MKKYYRKAKQFVADHDDEFFTGAVLAVSAAISAAGIYLVAKEMKRQEAAQDWTKEKNLEGKIVYQLGNGDYLATDSVDIFH